MPRFRDEWLVDRVLFDYVNGGTCSCCSFAMFLPGGTAELIGSVTDLETDQANAEVAALANHPWPADLRDHIWASRVKLRQKLKSNMKEYSSFWKLHGEQFQLWCRDNYTLLGRLLQLPRSEVVDFLEQKFDVHSAFKAVMETVLEQVAFFHLTEYPTDGKGETEVGFENALGFSRNIGFHLDIATSGNINEEIFDILINRIKSLGGPKLLEKGIKLSDDENIDNEGDADGPSNTNSSSAGPSFQSDRRLVRLMIARYWADLLMKRFLETNNHIEN